MASLSVDQVLDDYFCLWESLPILAQWIGHLPKQFISFRSVPRVKMDASAGTIEITRTNIPNPKSDHEKFIIFYPYFISLFLLTSNPKSDSTAQNGRYYKRKKKKKTPLFWK